MPLQSLYLQSDLLRKEYEYEKAEYLEAVKRAPMNGDVAEGDCWYPIRLGNTSYNIANQLVVDVFFDGTQPEDTSSDFEPGKIVNFFSFENGQMRVLNFNCTVSRIQEFRMEIAVNNRNVLMALENLASRGNIGVLLGIDDYSYQVMQSSLRQVRERNDEGFVNLRSVLIGERQPAFRDNHFNTIPWLNASQNAAVDWISEQLHRRGISVLRIGNPLRINDVMMECSYEYRYGNHPDYLELFSVRSSLREIKSRPKLGDKEHNQIRKLQHREVAKLLMKTLMDYVKLIDMEHLLREQVDFGIISPYKAQVRLLRKYMRNNKMLKPLRHQITINTVDGFQGQERDVILISMVRDNDSGNIGFLNDLRRMNVAITRAKMKLIVFGNAETMSKTKFYEKLVAYFQERGDFVTIEPEATES